MRTSPELASVPHRTAATTPDNLWEFLPRGGFPFKPARVYLRIRLGSAAVVEAEVPVSGRRTPKSEIPESWPIFRRGEGVWLLSAARMPPVGSQEIARGYPYHPDLPIGSLILTQAPEEVSLLLAEV